VDWILLVLIVFFVVWALQMVVVFRRQLARYDDQVASLNESTAEVRADADRYTRDNEEKQKELGSAKDAVQAAEEKESALKGRVEGLRKEEPRSTSRHRVELPPSE
tara:strand:+ start:498 stop:815 length:318 start_codon:yes stop_codon:yes gene_type:complete